MFEAIISIVLPILIICLFLAIWYSLLRQLGYSNLFSFLYSFLLFFVYPIALFILLFLKWPIQREARDLRIRYGEGTEGDAYDLLKEGMRHEVKGRNDEAFFKYQEVLTRFRNTTAGNDAKIAIGSLRSRLQKETKDE